MEWAFWGGMAVLGVMLVGLIWMKTHPLDDHGRPLRTFRIATHQRAIIRALMDGGNAPLSGYALRSRVGLPSESFYALITDMQVKGLVETELFQGVVGDADVPVPSRTYRLTDHGVMMATARGDRGTSGRHRS